MIAAMVMALALAGMAPPDPTPADPAPTPPPPSAPDTGASAVKDQQDKLDRMQQVYDQSCGNRGYAAYDDICNQLTAQLREVRIDLDKLQRDAAIASRKSNADKPK